MNQSFLTSEHRSFSQRTVGLDGLFHAWRYFKNVVTFLVLKLLPLLFFLPPAIVLGFRFPLKVSTQERTKMRFSFDLLSPNVFGPFSVENEASTVDINCLEMIRGFFITVKSLESLKAEPTQSTYIPKNSSKPILASSSLVRPLPPSTLVKTSYKAAEIWR
jgi:hypothetical protein